MDKLTIEEKAKRYDELSKEVKDFFDGKQKMYSDVEQTLSYLFPEFRDSEDEKIRKGIISGMKALQKKGKYTRFANIPVNNVIAWLEKQRDKDKLIQELGEYKVKYTQEVLSQHLEKQDQKPSNKIEPKFKVGDWIVYKDNVWKICNISLKTYYELLTINNEVSTRHIKDMDKDYHLWTIQDAKDGDVLTGSYGTFIFMGEGYCGVLSDNTFIRSTGNNEWTKDLHPATKKQRDTLFEKMREAGYEFDFEQKELKKIDNEEVNGEDYGIDSLYHAQRILEKTLGKVDGYQSDDGILEHKCAISAVKKLYEQKPAKIESKFHKGEWLCENEHNNYARFIQILEILNVQGKERYRISRDIHNDEDIVEFDFVEKYYHKFDIKDAKDGDILTNDFNEIFIFKNINEDIVISHCSIIYRTSDAIANTFDEIEVGSLSMVNFYPATKEQRDTLMKAMADAGYIWDSESKRLLSLKAGLNYTQNPTWSVEDMSKVQRICKYLDEAKKYYADITEVRECIDWLKSLKDRVIPQSKQEWSEEDECYMSECIGAIATKDGWSFEEKRKTKHWLKSLKDRYTWKPSDEQMDALRYVTNFDYGGHKATLVSLYE